MLKGNGFVEAWPNLWPFGSSCSRSRRSLPAHAGLTVENLAAAAQRLLDERANRDLWEYRQRRALERSGRPEEDTAW